MRNQFLIGLAFGFALATTARAGFNSWTDGSSKWEIAGDWSLGTAPSTSDAGNFITNAASKTVTINATTTNTPSAMIINNLTILAPGSATNTLFLNNAGTLTPLDITQDFTILTGGALVITNSSLSQNGYFSIDGGQAKLLGGSTASFSISSIFDSGSLIVAGGSNSFYTLSVAEGSFGTDTVWLTGGELDGSVALWSRGSLIQSNGVLSAEMDIEGGTLTVAGGTDLVYQLDIATGSDIFSFESTGTVWVTGGQLRAIQAQFSSAGIFIGTNVNSSVASIGSLTQSNGTMYAGVEDVENGTLTVAGGVHVVGDDGTGTNTFIAGYSLASGLIAGSGGRTGTVSITGGQLIATNVVIEDQITWIAGITIGPSVYGATGRGSFTQSNGTVQANFIRLDNSTLTIAGGTNSLGDLNVSYFGVNAGTSTVWITGGQLLVTTNFSSSHGDVVSFKSQGVISLGNYNGVGSLIQSNGTVQADGEFVGGNPFVGGGGTGALIISGGAHILGSQGLKIGLDCCYTSAVWVTGGQLISTNSPTIVGVSAFGQMTVSNGTVTLSSIVATNNNNGYFNTNVFTLVGGVVNSGGATVTNGLTFADGDGTHAATYHLLGGVHSFANGLRVRNNGTLSGCGTINGNVVVDAGGIVLADCGGSLTFTGILTNNGTMKAVGGSVLEGYGLVINNGTIDITGGTTNFHGGFVNNGTILAGAPSTNSWISGNGKWETSGNWSRGAAPALTDSADFITNAGNNAVTIDAATTNSPNTLAISNLTIVANTLQITNAVANTPLHLLNSFTDDGVVLLNTGAIVATNAQSLIGWTGMGSFVISNGLWYAGDVVVGYIGSGVLTIAGGTNTISSSLTVGSGPGTGAVWVTGGLLLATNSSILVIGQYGVGTLSQSNGTVDLYFENVEAGTLTVVGGTHIVDSVIVAGGTTPGNTGTIWIAGGSLLATNYQAAVSIGASGETSSTGIGRMTQSNGTVQVFSEDVSAGTLTVRGGTNEVLGALQVGDLGTGVVWVTGGQVIATNFPTLIGPAFSSSTPLGQMTISNGNVTLSLLVVTNNTFGSIINTNRFTLNGGTLNNGGAAITNALVFRVGDGSDAATYHLLGGVHSFADNLEVRNNGTLSGCGTINGNVVVDNGGLVLADCGGTLTFGGSVTNNGTMIATNGSVLEAYGLVVNNGTINISNGSTNFHGGYMGSGTVVTGSGQDIGLRIYDVTATIKIGAEAGTPTSAFRITKGGTNYGIILVDTNSPNASRIRVQTSSGTKALMKLP